MIPVMGDWYFSYDAVDRLMSATPDITAPTKYLNNHACWTCDRSSHGFGAPGD